MSAVNVVEAGGETAVYVNDRLVHTGETLEGEQLAVLRQLGVTVGRPVIDDSTPFPGNFQSLHFVDGTPASGDLSDLIIVNDQAGYYAFYLAGEKIAMTEALDHELWAAADVTLRDMADGALNDDEDFPAQLDGLLLADPARPHLHGGLAKLGASEEQMRRYHQLNEKAERMSDLDELTFEPSGAMVVEVYDGLEQQWVTVTVQPDGDISPDLISAW